MTYRRSVEIGWAIALAGLPFAGLVLPAPSLWYAQSTWMQGWIVVLWAASWGVPQRAFRLPVALASWFVWVSLWVLWVWTQTMFRTQQYPLPLVMSWVHCLSLLLFVQAALMTWTQEGIERILRWLSWSAAISIAYGWMQVMGADPFFTFTNARQEPTVHPLVGFVGNPAHFGLWLASLLPVLWWRKTWVWWGVGVTGLGLTGRLLWVNHSIAGLLASVSAISYLVWQFHRRWLWLWVPVVFLGTWWLWQHPSLATDSGRWAAWRVWWPHAKRNLLLGCGPGYIYALSQQVTQGPLFQWRQVHNEYYQALIEYGLIGVGCLLWVGATLVKTIRALPMTRLQVALVGILLAFAIGSGLHFSAHLWALGSIALFAYSGLYTLAQES